jgi:hypothetical protein
MNLWQDKSRAALCRHCGAKVWESSELQLWADADGFTVCMKAPLPPRGDKTGLPDYVFHQPMPDGMRGAPGTIR